MVHFFSRTFTYEYVLYILYAVDFVAHRVGVGAVQASLVACQHGHLEKIPKPAVCTCPLSRVRLLSLYHTLFRPVVMLRADFRWSAHPLSPLFCSRDADFDTKQRSGAVDRHRNWHY